MKLAFIGMSHLGLVYSTVAASNGNEVVCFDQDQLLINNLSNFILPIYEPDLDLLLREHKEKITFTTDLDKVKEAELIFISLDVVTNSNNESNLDSINYIISLIGPQLSINSCLIILSQVPPGFTTQIASDFAFEVYYQVETLVFGNAVERAQKPERLILGIKSNSKLNKSLEEYLSQFNAPILQMNYESAELAKMSINFLLATSITSTNTLSLLCRALKANWSDIKKVVDLDARIGEKAYTKPGLGLSGGNIERDVKNINDLLSDKTMDTSLCKTIFTSSAYAKLWPSRIIESLVNSGSKIEKITFWGLSYKQNTDSIKNSPAIENLKVLSPRFTIQAFDPYVSFKNSKLNIYRDHLSSLEGADALIIFTDSQAYKSLEISEILTVMGSNIVIDPMSVLNSNKPHSAQYFTLDRDTTLMSQKE